MDTAWTWELSGHCAKYSFLTESKGLTMREVERTFQLDPEPPVHENLNDYIIKAVQSRKLCWFSFFLHHYENRLNGRIRRFLLREGLDRYDPERFLDCKMGCVLAMLDCLRVYDPAQGADFLTYAHHFIGNALLTCRMQEEAGSFENVDEYKAVRGIAWLYNQSGQSEQAAIQKHVRKTAVPRKPQQSFWHWPNKIEAVFRFIRPYRMRIAKKPARMSAGMITGTMRRFYGTAAGLKLSGKRLKS